jgi:7-cyano-7-deazaguanine reductase
MKKKQRNGSSGSSFEALDKRFDVDDESAIQAGVLETFPYEYPKRDVKINIDTDEFTAVCPFSGLPDFGTIRVDYIPDKLIVELRSFKYYLLSFRTVGIYQEHLVNLILEDLVAVCKPRWMVVSADYKVRGGVHTITSVEHRKK